MRRDPVTPAVYEAVRERDGWGCVVGGDCEGPIELDHIHGGGLGRRGPSTMDNLVSLCRFHHRQKTENARTWRVALDEYVGGHQ